MKELVAEHQAYLLMLGILVLAPLIGLAWGAATKRLVKGLVLGLAIGAGNFLLWTVYNAITDHLGLDTVKNLLVNLGLFIVLGVIIGLAVGWFSGRERKGES